MTIFLTAWAVCGAIAAGLICEKVGKENDIAPVWFVSIVFLVMGPFGLGAAIGMKRRKP